MPFLDKAKTFGKVAVEAVRSGGKIAIPLSLLESQANKHLTSLDPRLRSIRFRTVEGRVNIEAQAEERGAQLAIHASFVIETFLITHDQARAVLRFQDNISVEGQNLLGKIAARMVRNAINQALQKLSYGDTANNDPLTVENNWPEIIVDANQLPALEKPRRFGLLLALPIMNLLVGDGELILVIGRRQMNLA